VEALRRSGRINEAANNASELAQTILTNPKWGLKGESGDRWWTFANTLCQAGRATEAIALLRDAIALARTPDGTEEVQRRLLNILSWALLRQDDSEHGVAAESAARECVRVCEEAVPGSGVDKGMCENARSQLGGALLSQSRFHEAEPLLISAYAELAGDDVEMPSPADIGIDLKREALERIVNLYEAWHIAEPGKGYAAKAEEYRALLEAKPKDAAGR
jgi:tetratricopeptide (TPR) repeat protein